MTTIEQTGAEEVAWDLSDLYASGDDPRIESDMAEAETAAAAFRDRYYGKVASLSAAELAEAVAEVERIESIATRAIYFAHLVFSTNMADTARGALVAKLGEKGAGLETQLLFFGLEWAAIEDGPAAQLLEDPALAHWRHWLSAQRVFRPYLLTEPEEKILTEKAVSGVSAWTRLYEEVLGAMRIDLPGEPSPSRSRRRWRSSTRPTGASAGERPRPSPSPSSPACAREPRSSTRSWSTSRSTTGCVAIRPGSRPRNLSNETTDEAVQALVDAADVALRRAAALLPAQGASCSGSTGSTHYDRFAPIADDSTTDLVGRGAPRRRRGVRQLLERGGRRVERFFDENWIDAPVRPDKRHGAFCATNVPGVHPYVFMNYTGDRRSILTLAHELGHALHGSLAEPLGLFNASTPLTTAETASVFGEALTFKGLLADRGRPAPAARPAQRAASRTRSRPSSARSR